MQPEGTSGFFLSSQLQADSQNSPTTLMVVQNKVVEGPNLHLDVGRNSAFVTEHADKGAPMMASGSIGLTFNPD